MYVRRGSRYWGCSLLGALSLMLGLGCSDTPSPTHELTADISSVAHSGRANPGEAADPADRAPVGRHCEDGVKNFSETDVDCGGPHCSPCTATEQCKNDNDCLGKVCEEGLCLDPTGAECDLESGPQLATTFSHVNEVVDPLMRGVAGIAGDGNGSLHLLDVGYTLCVKLVRRPDGLNVCSAVVPLEDRTDRVLSLPRGASSLSEYRTPIILEAPELQVYGQLGRLALCITAQAQNFEGTILFPDTMADAIVAIPPEGPLWVNAATQDRGGGGSCELDAAYNGFYVREDGVAFIGSPLHGSLTRVSDIRDSAAATTVLATGFHNPFRIHPMPNGQLMLLDREYFNERNVFYSVETDGTAEGTKVKEVLALDFDRIGVIRSFTVDANGDLVFTADLGPPGPDPTNDEEIAAYLEAVASVRATIYRYDVEERQLEASVRCARPIADLIFEQSSETDEGQSLYATHPGRAIFETSDDGDTDRIYEFVVE